MGEALRASILRRLHDKLTVDEMAEDRRKPAAIERLPPNVLSKLIDKHSRCALRLCSKECRSAVDAEVRSLRVMYGAAVPEQRPPEPVAKVEASLRAIQGRDCRPRSFSLRLQEDDPDREDKGLKVLEVISQSNSVTELVLHGLPLSPTISGRIGSLFPGLTKLSLTGACNSHESLQEGLAPLLRASPHLEDLTLLNIGGAKDDSSGAATVQRVWEALQDHAPLRRLYLFFHDDMQLHAAACEPGAMGLGPVPQLQALRLDLGKTESVRLDAMVPVLCSVFANLRGLKLNMDYTPTNLLQCVASLPLLESFRVLGWGTSCELQGLSYLAQMTSLTSLSLAAVLSPSSLDAAVQESPDRKWSLPPQLQTLRLGRPLSLEHLASMNPPSTLRSVTLSTECMELPSSNRETVQLLADLAPRLVAWDIARLGFTAAMNSIEDVLSCIEPLQLCSLHLRLRSAGLEDAKTLGDALAKALGPSLRDLVLEACEGSLSYGFPYMLPGLVQLRQLQTLTLCNLNLCFAMTPDVDLLRDLLVKLKCAALPSLRRDAALAAKEAAGAAARAARVAPGAGAAEAASGTQGAAALAATRAAESAKAVDDALAAAVQEIQQPPSTTKDSRSAGRFAAMLLVLSSRGINVRLKNFSEHVAIIVRLVRQMIQTEGAGASWGSI